MKKQSMIVFATFLTIGLLLFATGVVAARGVQHGIPPFAPEEGPDRGEDENWGPRHGMMGWSWGENVNQAPMVEAMIDALVEYTDFYREEILGRLDEGEHLFNIALEAGLSQQAFYELWDLIREKIYFNGYGDMQSNYSHMRPFGGGSDFENEDGFLPFCHGSDEGGAPNDGYPFRGRGW